MGKGFQDVTRTFCGVLLDPTADAVLAPVGEIFAKVRH